jgi:hypothetical protein
MCSAFRCSRTLLDRWCHTPTGPYLRADLLLTQLDYTCLRLFLLGIVRRVLLEQRQF